MLYSEANKWEKLKITHHCHGEIYCFSPEIIIFFSSTAGIRNLNDDTMIIINMNFFTIH